MVKNMNMASEAQGAAAVPAPGPGRQAAVVEVGREAGRPVDLAHLARQTFGSRELETEVLRLFQGQSVTLLERIRHEPATERLRAAHTLKGSARGIGAWRVARLAEAVEKVDQGPAEAARVGAELASAIEEANDFIVALSAA